MYHLYQGYLCSRRATHEMITCKKQKKASVLMVLMVMKAGLPVNATRSACILVIDQL